MLFSHIFLFQKYFGVVYLLERQVTIDIHSKKTFVQKYKKQTYGTQIYLICLLCEHIIWCHNCPYHILVHIQAGDTATDKEKRLFECVGNAREPKEKVEQESYSVMCKERDLKWWLVPGVEMSHEELEHLVHEIENYKKSMEQAQKQMQSTSSAFMATHSGTMEVFGVAGKVQYQQRFSHKGVRHFRCMFCMMVLTVMKFTKTYHQLPLDSIWSYCEYFLYMLQIFVWQCHCNCICMCKYMWILSIWKYVTLW